MAEAALNGMRKKVLTSGLLLVLTAVFLSVPAASQETSNVSDAENSDINPVKRFVDGFIVDDDLSVSYEGSVEQGSSGLVEVRNRGEAVEGASVAVNGVDAGLTDAEGRRSVEVPDAALFRVKVEKGELKGYLVRRVN